MKQQLQQLFDLGRNAGGNAQRATDAGAKNDWQMMRIYNEGANEATAKADALIEDILAMVDTDDLPF